MAAIERLSTRDQDSAYRYQKVAERSEQVIVGVNKYTMTDEPSEIPILVIDESVRARQGAARKTRAGRDQGAVTNALENQLAAPKSKHAARDNRCLRLYHLR